MNDGTRRPAAQPEQGESFAEVVLPHLDAGRRLASWMLRNEHDAEDAVQEASLRALRYFRTFTGGNGRAWFLRIVRNTCHGWRGNGRFPVADLFDEECHSDERAVRDPEALVLQTDEVRLIEQAMRDVPDRFRELLVLRELRGLSYRELADVMGMPIGSVMSGLFRGRQALRRAVNDQLNGGDVGGRSANDSRVAAVRRRTGSKCEDDKVSSGDARPRRAVGVGRCA